MKWQPIETAPHAQIVLLAWRGWPSNEWEYEAGFASFGDIAHGKSTRWCHGQATHWMPLPPPPKEEECK